MKRYQIFGDDWAIEHPNGDWLLYYDIAPLIAAVDKLLAAKGRYHTEQNYKALAEARAKMEKAE